MGDAISFSTSSTFLAWPTFDLEDLLVPPACRRLGLGRPFVAELRREDGRERCGRMEWQMLDWNTPAQRF